MLSTNVSTHGVEKIKMERTKWTRKDGSKYESVRLYCQDKGSDDWIEVITFFGNDGANLSLLEWEKSLRTINL